MPGGVLQAALADAALRSGRRLFGARLLAVCAAACGVAGTTSTAVNGSGSGDGLGDRGVLRRLPELARPPTAVLERAADKVALCLEYLDLAALHPVKQSSLVFHCRRMLRDELTRYQLLEEAVTSQSLAELRGVEELAQRWTTESTGGSGGGGGGGRGGGRGRGGGAAAGGAGRRAGGGDD